MAKRFSKNMVRRLVSGDKLALAIALGRTQLAKMGDFINASSVIPVGDSLLSTNKASSYQRIMMLEDEVLAINDFSIGFHFLYNDPGGSAPMLAYPADDDFLTAPAGEWALLPHVSTNTLNSARRPLFTWYGDEPWKWTGLYGKGCRQYFQDPDIPWPISNTVFTASGRIVIGGATGSTTRISAAWFQTVGETVMFRIVVTVGSEWERIYEINADQVINREDPTYSSDFVSLLLFDLVAQWPLDDDMPRSTRAGSTVNSDQVYLMPWVVNRSATEMMTMRYREKAEGTSTRLVLPVGLVVDLSAIPSGFSTPVPSEIYPTPDESSYTASFTATAVISFVEEFPGGEKQWSGSGTNDADEDGVSVILVGVDYDGDTRLLYRYREVTSMRYDSSVSGQDIFNGAGDPDPTSFIIPGEVPALDTFTSSRSHSILGTLEVNGISVVVLEQETAFTFSTSRDFATYDYDFTNTFFLHSIMDMDTRHPDVHHYRLDIQWIETISVPVYPEPTGGTRHRDYTLTFFDNGLQIGQFTRDTSASFSGLPAVPGGVFRNESNTVTSTYPTNVSDIYVETRNFIFMNSTVPDFRNYLPAVVDGTALQRSPGMPGWPLIWSSPLTFESPFEAMTGAAARLPNGDYLTTLPDITIDFDTDDPHNDIRNVILFDTLINPGGLYSRFWRNHVIWQESVLFKSNVLTEAQINALAGRTEPERWRVYDIIAPTT